MAKYVGSVTEGGNPKTLHMNIPGRCAEAAKLDGSSDAIYFDDRCTAAAFGYSNACNKCDWSQCPPDTV